MRTFYPTDAFAAAPTDIKLLPFRFARFEGEELLVNEAGEFLFAPVGTVTDLLDNRIAPKSDLYKDLKAKHFLYDDTSSPLLDILASKVRTKFDHIYGGTKLHIFVVTLRCEHSCHYCQVSRQTAHRGEFDMSLETADRSIDLMFQSPSQSLTLEMQGGEPLLAFDTIRYIVANAKRVAKTRQRDLSLVVTTNLACATDDMLKYFRDEGIKISTSLDGPAWLHNTNRPRPGNDSYEKAIDGINRARAIVGYENVAALMTTTSASLDSVTKIIDEYVANGFHAIFLRPISPYGFALRTKTRTGYEMDQFLAFYKKGLEHILAINQSGYRLTEIYTQILLSKILTPQGTGYVDLQTPSGAAFNVLAYNYNGDVFASDEARMLAEMQDWTFRLGNVHKDTRRNLFMSEAAMNLFDASCNTSLAGCSDCAFQSFCGTDPVYHHATQGDMHGFRPESGFCRRNMEVIKHLFHMIRQDDPSTMAILWSWVTGQKINRDNQQCA